MFLLLKTVPWCGRSGETSAEFFPCSWLPPTTHTHSTFVAAFNGVENRYQFYCQLQSELASYGHCFFRN